MNRSVVLYKSIVIVIFVLLVGAGFSPVIGSDFENEQNVSSMTFYTFGRSGTKKCKVELPIDTAEEISYIFKDLKNRITCEQSIDSTQKLKIDFVDLLDRNGLIPKGLSKDNIVSLLNPKWFNCFKGNNPFTRNGFFSSIGSRNGFNPKSSFHTGSAFFCSMAGEGSGLLFPPIMIPRPRLITSWAAYIGANSMAANLISGHGFIASGPQFGIALGFMGIGLSFAIPGEPAYFGFGGYALAAFVGAEDVETYPPNQKPIISNENPSDGSIDVSLSLSKLSFRIRDKDGDKMSYTVTTDPDIGSGEGSGFDGVYSVPINNLEYDKMYQWKIIVTDNKDTVEKENSFYTEIRPPFDPFDEGWKYRKKIKINHSQVLGDLNGFPVLVSTIDSDLAVKAQEDGEDILFMDDKGVAKKLYHELEIFDDTSGKLVTWVRIPSLFSSVDTELYMYYGNPTCGYQEYPDRVWCGKYGGVWHLNENPTGVISDSTINNNDGLSYGQMTSSDLIDGKIGYCLELDGDDDYIAIHDSKSLKPEEVTLIGWFKPLEQNPDTGFFLSKKCHDYYHNADGHTYGICWRNNDSIQGGIEQYLSSPNQWAKIGNYKISINYWYHLVLTFNESTDTTILSVNGIEEGRKSQIHSSALLYNDAWDFLMGASRMHDGSSHTINDWFKCQLDEIRVLNIPLGSDWISTEYNNQNDPLNFINVGSEESGP
jgi:hypothetical protein